MQRLLQKSIQGIEPVSDNRGRQVPANKTSEDPIKAVCEHISSFPTVKSHYTRHQQS